MIHFTCVRSLSDDNILNSRVKGVFAEWAKQDEFQTFTPFEMMDNFCNGGLILMVRVGYKPRLALFDVKMKILWLLNFNSTKSTLSSYVKVNVSTIKLVYCGWKLLFHFVVPVILNQTTVWQSNLRDFAFCIRQHTLIFNSCDVWPPCETEC